MRWSLGKLANTGIHFGHNIAACSRKRGKRKTKLTKKQSGGGGGGTKNKEIKEGMY
jgi:hypothetical protein